MAKRRKPETELLVLRVTDYSAYSSYSFNWSMHDKKSWHRETNLYEHHNTINVDAEVVFSDTKDGHTYSFTLYEDDGPRQSATLSRYQILNKDGTPSYRTVRGVHTPQFKPPPGVGLVEKTRGQDRWTGTLWLPSVQMSFILQVLTGTKPLYISFHEKFENRARWMLQFELTHEAPG